MIPSFLICGAQRSATTTLARALGENPHVYLPPREVKYFSKYYGRGMRWYTAQFRQYHQWQHVEEKHGVECGEKSVTYMEDPLVAQRIKRDLPDARLIFILRNPVERAYSNYLYSWENGLEWMDFEEALEQEPCRHATYPDEDTQWMKPFSYTWRGLYADRLRTFFDLFPRNQIGVLFYEYLEANLERTVNQVERFLGIPAIPHSNTWLHKSSGARRMPFDAREYLEGYFEHPNLMLADLIDIPLPASWNDGGLCRIRRFRPPFQCFKNSSI